MQLYYLAIAYMTSVVPTRVPILLKHWCACDMYHRQVQVQVCHQLKCPLSSQTAQ